MLKKTVTYEDFNGNQVQEDLYFNLSKSEMIDMEMSEGGAMSERLDRIKKSNDTTAMYREMRGIVLSAYGVRSEDGRRFLKNDDIRADFESSAAFDEFFFDLFRDTDAIVDFINGIMPAKAIEQALAERDKNKISVGEEDEEQIKALRDLQERSKPASTEEPKRGTFGQTEEQERKTPQLTPEQFQEYLRNNPDALDQYGK